MANGSQDDWILILEDDADIREALEQILLDEGHRVVTAASGSAALATVAAARTPPCLVLLDLMMPGMSGPQFSAELRRDARCASVPIVVVSAAGKAVAPMAESLGAAAHIEKPLDLDAFMALVHRVLDRR